VAQINAGQRTRLAWLMAQVTDHGGAEYLTVNEHKELLYLLQIAGLIPDTPLESAPGQHISGRSALLQTLAMKYPRQPISGRQAICALWRERMDWGLSPKQRQLQRMKQTP
jgi:hypothetical protein